MRLVALGAAALVGLVVADAQAQPTSGGVPAGFPRPGEEVRPAPLAVPATPPDAPTSPLPADPTASGAFRLGGVILEGATALPTDRLAPLWQPLVGETVTVDTLDAVAAQITAAYRAEGFVLSQALVPAQTIAADGIVRIQVVEGFVDRLTADGGSASAQAIASRLLEPAAAERPLRLGTLERGVLIARDTLGGSVETVLEPSPTTFGAADLTARLEPKPVEAFAVVDNRSSRLFGSWVARAGGSLTNVMGLGERIDAQAAAALDTPRLWFVQLGVGAPVAALDGTWLDGSRLRVRGDVTRAEPDLSRLLDPGFASVQDESNLGAEWEVPLVRARRENLFVGLAVNYRDSKADTRLEDESIAVDTDRLLTFTPRVTYDRADRFGGVSLLDLRLRTGAAIDGLTRIGSTGAGAPKADFTFVGGGLQRLQQFGPTRWSLYSEVIWQYAFDSLPTSERFALGGDRLGRGYSPGNTTGDSGYGGRLELRRAVELPAWQDIQSGMLVYGFGEWGSAIDRSDRRDGQQWEVLGSAGLGARIDLGAHVTLTPELARQIAGRPSDRSDPSRETRFLFGAVARF